MLEIGTPSMRPVLVAYGEVALAAAPDREAALLVPPGGCVLRLDVSLVNRFGPVFPLDDEVRGGEPRFKVSVGMELPVPHVRAARPLPGGPVLVEYGSVRSHGALDVRDRRQRLVDDVNQGQRLFGDMRAGGGDGGDGVALVEDLAPRQHVVGRRLAERGLARNGVWRADVVRGGDGPDVRVSLRPAGVDAHDARVGVGAAEHLAVEHAGDADIGSVERLAGHLVYAVVADRPRADHPVLPGFLLSLGRHIFPSLPGE